MEVISNIKLFVLGLCPREMVRAAAFVLRRYEVHALQLWNGFVSLIAALLVLLLSESFVKFVAV